MKEGIVFNIQRYSIHDGPGIRTTVFMKGCPLRCLWCSNPESMNPYPEIFFREERCNRCVKCLDLCSHGAITLNESGVQIDRAKCDLCMKCEEVCYSGAISRIGKKTTVEEVVMEVMRDELFYRNSRGGVTISGGEPLYQAEFSLNLLKECKDRSLNTALDTSGYAEWRVLDAILKYTDLVLFDIKHLDPEMHRKGTGVGNKLILRNLEKTLEKEVKVWIRVPVILNYNSSDQYIGTLAKFLSKKPVEKISLLNYHEWGRRKYEFLGRDYPFREAHSISNGKLQSLKEIMDPYGLRVTIGY